MSVSPKFKLSYEQQIEHLKKKGIQFNKMSEAEALCYLQQNNYLFKLISYRKIIKRTLVKVDIFISTSPH